MKRKIKGILRGLMRDGSIVESSAEMDLDELVVREAEIEEGWVGRGIESIFPDDYGVVAEKFVEQLDEAKKIEEESGTEVFPLWSFVSREVKAIGCLKEDREVRGVWEMDKEVQMKVVGAEKKDAVRED